MMYEDYDKQLDLTEEKITFFEHKATMEFKDFDEKRRLDKSWGAISKLSKLKSSPNLEAVQLQGNNLSSLEGIEILKRIKYLNLRRNNLRETSFKPLLNCIELQYLNLEGNMITSLATLPVLSNLKYLNFSRNKLHGTSFKPLQNCIELQYLNLSHCEIASIDTLPVLSNLTCLDLGDNPLNGISFEPLRYCLKLQHIGLWSSEISSLATMPVLPNLKELNADDNKISTMESLSHLPSHLPSLEKLSLSGNQITSLAGLPFLPNLKGLNATRNKISTMESLSHLPSLEQLGLSGNQITSLAGLSVLPNLKYLGAANNNISTLSGFPFLLSLEQLDIDGPILRIPRVKAVLILLVGPSLKWLNRQDVREVAIQYPAHTSFCIRNGWSICDPKTATQSTFSFLIELWKERTPPGYTLKEAFADQPFEGDACDAHFSFNHFYGNNYGLILKYQWFIGDTIHANFSPINGETDSVYWPKKENVGKYLKVECTSMLGGAEFPPIFAMCEPVLSGTGIPKVIHINVIGELMEGKFLKGWVKIAWCGGTPGKGASSWLRGRSNNSEIISGAEEEEYKLTLDDVDAHIIYVYTPITQEGLKGEPTVFTTGFIKAGPPMCNSLNLVGSLVEGACLGFKASYIGGVKGNCIQEWYRIKNDGKRQKLTGADTLELTLDVVGMQIEFVFTPVRNDGVKGSSNSVVSEVVSPAEPMGVELIVPTCREDCEISPKKTYYGGKEGSGKYTWYRTSQKLIQQDLLSLTSSSEALIVAQTLNYRPSLEDVGFYLALHWIPTRSDEKTGSALLGISQDSVLPGTPRLVSLQIIGEAKEGCVLVAYKSYMGGKEGDSIFRWYSINSRGVQTKIEGATSASYTLTNDDIGCYFQVSCIPVRNDGTRGQVQLSGLTIAILPGKKEQEEVITASTQNAFTKSKEDDKKQWEAALHEEIQRREKIEEELAALHDEIQRREKIEEELADVKKKLAECCIRFTLEELQKATDNFDKSRKLGEGGFGIVYKGFLRHTNVAIKMLTNNLYENARGFKEEIETLVQARHPNLVTLIGASEEGSEKLALVYEFVEGGSLQDQLFKGKNDSNPPLSWRTRIRIASDICSALIFLHSTPRVHGDLKPDNILLDSNYVSKLSDFGTCRLLTTTKTRNTAFYASLNGAAVTAYYMDPVYYTSGELTAQSDVYAFGIVLLQLVTGRNPIQISLFVKNAINEKNFDKIIDLSAGWPRNRQGQFVEAMELAELGLKCSNIKPQDREDLAENVWSVIESLKKNAASSN